MFDYLGMLLLQFLAVMFVVYFCMKVIWKPPKLFRRAEIRPLVKWSLHLY